VLIVMGIAQLAQQIVSLVAPVLPALGWAGGKGVEGLMKKVGEEAYGAAKQVWEKLRPKVESVPEAKAAVEELIAQSEDADVQAIADAQDSLRLQLKKLLMADSSLAKEMEELLKNPSIQHVVVTASGERAVAIAGGLSNSTISTGDQNPREGQK
jgi:hypothetical protein